MIPIERVYWSIGVTDGVDPRNRDVLAMTLLLRRIDQTITITADEWDEVAAAGARIVRVIAHDADDGASERLLLPLALHEARSWLRAREVGTPAPERSPRTTMRVRVRTAIRDA